MVARMFGRSPLRSVVPHGLVLAHAPAVLALVSACGGSGDMLPPPPPPPALPAAYDAGPPAAEPAPSTPAPAKATLPPVTLTEGAASPDPAAPLPTVVLAQPTRDQVIASNKVSDFSVKLDVKNWPTAQGSSHVHLILDNRPYKAIYDPKQPIKLSELTGGEALSEGRHVLVAFPSRANHESVKSKGALVVVPFWVGKKGDSKDDPTKKPMLVYSRPKGEYKGEMANHVLVDFYVHAVTLAAGKEHVNVSVTGPGIERALEAKVERFGTPLYLDNLRNGTYELKVELADASNRLIPGAWNSTTRTIKIDRDAPSDPASAHGGHTSAPAADAGAKQAAPEPAPMPTMTSPMPSMGGAPK